MRNSRPEDIVEIGEHFLASYGLQMDASGHIAAWLRSAEARAYPWPGNVRELQNALRNLLLGLPPGLKGHVPQASTRSGEEVPAAIASGSTTLQTVIDWYMERVLDATEGNLSQAAKILDVDRSTVRRTLARRGLGSANT